jgi:hypothetical protein
MIHQHGKRSAVKSSTQTLLLVGGGAALLWYLYQQSQQTAATNAALAANQSGNYYPVSTAPSTGDQISEVLQSAENIFGATS